MLDNEFDNVAIILKTLHFWVPMDDYDRLKWNLNANDSFTTKSTFLKLTKRSPTLGSSNIED